MFIPPVHLPSIPASLPGYRAIRPRWSPEGIAQFAARLGVNAPAKASGPWLLCRDEALSLEIYQASHSARLTRTAFDLEGVSGEPGDLLSNELAVEHANRFVDGLKDLHKSQTSAPTVSRIEAITQSSNGTAPDIRTVAVQVNYRFTLDGLPLRGPGAKAQVTLGASGTIEQAYLFSRQVERTTAPWTTRPADASLDALTRSPHFEAVTRTADVEVSRVNVGWLCLPPTSVQDILFPVYEVRGRVIAKADTTRDFVAFVAAARTPPRSPALHAFAADRSPRWPPLVIA